MVVPLEFTHPNVKDYFKEIPFYNRPTEKPKIKRLKNIGLSAELPFFEKLSMIKTNRVFSGYGMSYKVEIVEGKDLIVQSEASKLSIKNLFGDLLNEMNGIRLRIRYQI